MLRSLLLAATCAVSLLTPLGAQADEAEDAFVEANILSIFYHEIGHAVIDKMQVPIFGQEEDAADVLSVMMIDWLYEEEAAQELAFNSAFGYINDPDGVEEVAWWDLHGPDQQRYYNHICLFYGADPEKREDLAYDLGLPEDRAQMCPVEYEQAANSWGAVFDEMSPESGVPLVFHEGSGKEAELINQVLSDEVKNLEQDMSLPSEVIVKVDSCGEPNAFYDPEEASIIFCTEFIPHLRSIYQANLEN
ncbi:Putative metallopeptidase [Pseudovibrio denitrificans]|uniref:Putative metallopeptidase n=1 Tax=Pseudovibrio denitrificans TaxID=258256 RepID=A0A1I7DEP9_9HYPH|nr:DUF4344 domain-containing metallopeptidase [Pseudovibrio denitrificans]SFU10159.1 Putative metallopeptidase [Pseudovibrio denitrificans]